MLTYFIIKNSVFLLMETRYLFHNHVFITSVSKHTHAHTQLHVKRASKDKVKPFINAHARTQTQIVTCNYKAKQIYTCKQCFIK